ncbi:HIP1R protein, partial [Polypterus senegalus]
MPGVGCPLLWRHPSWETQEQALGLQHDKDRLALFYLTLEEAEKIVQDALARLDDPAHASCTCSADYLISRSEAALDSVGHLEVAVEHFMADRRGLNEMLQCVAPFAHLIGDTIVQGSATSHMAPIQQADLLSEAVKTCGAEALSYLQLLKKVETLANAESATLKGCLSKINLIGEGLRPKGLDLKQGELGDLVEEEMTATFSAVESAAKRIEEMLSKSRTADTGVKLEVNESDAADLVVQGKGKFEDLMVCSHEIAASTAQLVAASKVKADKDSANLCKLQTASRAVNQATASVVASTKSGKSQIEEKGRGGLSCFWEATVITTGCGAIILLGSGRNQTPKIEVPKTLLSPSMVMWEKERLYCGGASALAFTPVSSPLNQQRWRGL